MLTVEALKAKRLALQQEAAAQRQQAAEEKARRIAASGDALTHCRSVQTSPSVTSACACLCNSSWCLQITQKPRGSVWRHSAQSES